MGVVRRVVPWLLVIASLGVAGYSALELSGRPESVAKPEIASAFVPNHFYRYVNTHYAPHLRYCPESDAAANRIPGSRLDDRYCHAVESSGAPVQSADTLEDGDAERTYYRCDAGGATAEVRAERAGRFFCLLVARRPSGAGAGGGTIAAGELAKGFLKATNLDRELRRRDFWEPAGEGWRLVRHARVQALPTDAPPPVHTGRYFYRNPSAALTFETLEFGQRLTWTTPTENEAVDEVSERSCDLAPLFRGTGQSCWGDERPLKPRESIALKWGRERWGLFLRPLPIREGVDDRKPRIEVVYKPPDVVDPKGTEIRVNGVALRTKGHAFLLDESDSITFTHGDTTMTARLRSGQAGVVSHVDRQEGRYSRHIEPRSGLEQFIGPLSDQLTRLLNVLRLDASPVDKRRVDSVRRALAGVDVRLTLDETLQTEAVEVLQGWMERYTGKLLRKKLKVRRPEVAYKDGLWFDNSGNPQPPPMASLVTIDVDSGDLIALASYPTSTELALMTERLETLGPGRGGRRGLQRRRAVAAEVKRALVERMTEGDVNLRPHAIGSVFKPIIAWAAAQIEPRLLDFSQSRKVSKSRRTWGLAREAAKKATDLPGQCGDKDPTKCAGLRSQLEQCMVRGSVGRSRGQKSYDLQRNYGLHHSKGTDAHICDPQASGRFDLCAALTWSENLFIIELMARIVAWGVGEHVPRLRNAALSGALDDDRRIAGYELPAYCGRQRLRRLKKQKAATLCKPPSRRLIRGHYRGENVNEAVSKAVKLTLYASRGGGADAPPPALPVHAATGVRGSYFGRGRRLAFLGPLGALALTGRVMALEPFEAEDDEALGPTCWSEVVEPRVTNLFTSGETELRRECLSFRGDVASEALGFSWLLPDFVRWEAPSEHAGDARCVDALEPIATGGGVNEWNNIAVVQTLAEIYTGKRRPARLINAVRLSKDEDGRALFKDLARIWELEPELEPGAWFDVPMPTPEDLDRTPGTKQKRGWILKGLRNTVSLGLMKKRTGKLARRLEKHLAEQSAPGAPSGAWSVKLSGKTGTRSGAFEHFSVKWDRKRKRYVVDDTRDSKRLKTVGAFLATEFKPVAGKRAPSRFITYAWFGGLPSGHYVTSAEALDFLADDAFGMAYLRKLASLARERGAQAPR